jgi:hypothetical protein
MVDAPALGADAARHGSSSLPLGTFFMSFSERQYNNLDAAIFAVELAHQYRTLKEIDLHGRMLDEVEQHIDRFLTDMSSAGENGCGIVCGTGTGAMKRHVQTLLKPYLHGVVGKIIDKGPILLIVFER